MARGAGGTGPLPAAFEAPADGALAGDAGPRFFAEWLRDGRLALGLRGTTPDAPSEIHTLAPDAALALVAWLTPLVEREWLPVARRRAEAQLALAEQVHGEERGGIRRTAMQMLDELPPRLLARALALLANAIGPGEHARKVRELNRTANFSDDLRLRQSLAEETSAFAYVLAAAALFDAIDPDAPEFETRSR